MTVFNEERMQREVWCPKCKMYSDTKEIVPLCPKCKCKLVNVVISAMTSLRLTGFEVKE